MLSALSADGGRVVYSAAAGGNFDIWTYDLSLGTRTRLSNNPLTDSAAVWSPDGAQVTFTSFQSDTNYDILLAPADGSSPPTALVSTDRPEAPHDWSSDGRFILYTSISPETQRDIGYLEHSGTTDNWESHSFLSTTASEEFPRLSPDGRYVAYASDESGQNEIYVQPFPDGGRRTTVSTAGATRRFGVETAVNSSMWTSTTPW